VACVIVHARKLWPGWGIAWPAPFLAWASLSAVLGTLRWEHVALAVVVPALAYGTSRTKRLFLGLLPFGFLALVYDAMRYVKDLGITPERVHSCDLRALDTRLFGIGAGASKVALPEWLQTHATPLLDRLCAMPYGTFIYVSLGVAVWLYAKDYAELRRFGWTFLCLNLAGFVTYHIYPAAPPWYVQTHGCVADLASRASEGPNLARVDALLGFGYFRGFYGRSSDVFGAVPSLHVAYPLLSVFYGWKHWRLPGRALGLGFFLLMCFSAVYLDHHWVIDVLIGVTYTFVVEAIVKWLWTRDPETLHPARAVEAA
jgi:hypothetical protein